jgi:predicted MFS family arabinose efflux permease
MSYTTSLNLLLVMNGIGIIGRLLPSHFADRVGTLTMFVPMSVASALLMYCWIAVSSAKGLHVWAALCGIAIGAIQSLFPAALVALTTDLRKQGTRIGMTFTIVSFGLLTGPPIEGALISALEGRYIAAQVFAGTSIAIGTIFIVIAREVKRRRIGGSFWAKV